MKNSKHFLTAGLIVAIVAMSGCANNEPAWVDHEIGNAVAQVIEGQLYDPEAAAEPGDAAVDNSSADKTKKVIDAWRDSLAAPKESAGNVVINVGN